MKKQITIGSNQYNINYDPKTAMEVLNKIVEWMEDEKHYAAHSGEGIMQDDNCQIDSPELISDIVDDFLQPEPVEESYFRPLLTNHQ